MSAAPDARLLGEAADWMMTFRYGEPSDADRRAFDLWCQQSPAHGDAWAKAEAVAGTFARVPGNIGQRAVPALKPDRRRLQLLGALLVAAPLGALAWRQLPWREWTADVATATGERKAMPLADGSQLVLNTSSAVDIVFSASERRVRLLAGEILITTHADPSPVHRPFIVETPHGSVKALGTRFSVRRLDDTSRVAVFEHAVRIDTARGDKRILRAGEQADFGGARIETPLAVDDSAALWERGMLLARNLRLADVLAELGRHRRGVLSCDAAVADLRVSGALSLADTDAALELLERSLPLHVERVTRYWVLVRPAPNPKDSMFR